MEVTIHEEIKAEKKKKKAKTLPQTSIASFTKKIRLRGLREFSW